MSSPLANFVWETRYRLSTPAAERSVEDSWTRVATAVAAVEHEPRPWAQAFLGVLRDFHFLPGGRILAGAGARRAVTLCNCFVMGHIEDSIEGIFDALKEGAVTMQQGGGVGYDFSTLRPRGSRARASGMTASGPVSFMHVWDTTCATLTSTGSRRGAMMATLRCDHPDIEEFIGAKRNPRALRQFNLSVLVTDAFMQAVRADAAWPLVFPESALEEAPGELQQRLDRQWSGGAGLVHCRILRTVSARALWSGLCAGARASGEPGILFVDRINALNNLGYRETLSATNPCGEVPLPPYGACTLGSVNLTAFVRGPFTPAAMLDFKAIEHTVALAVRFLDDVVDIAGFPLARQRDEAQATRRIGLGITGLADALALLGLRYDSQAARQLAAETMRTIRDAAYGASIELAGIKGRFPAFDRDRFLERPFIRSLPRALRAAIAAHGIRNGHLLAIAPAGSISLLADNVSSGIEPIFQLQGVRRVRAAEGAYRTFDIIDRAYALWRERNGDAAAPAYLVEAGDIDPRDQLLMQASLQPFVDAAISKTLALPTDAAAGEVDALYARAYDAGLKGCTVYRRRSRADVIGGCEPRNASPAAQVECDAG